MKNKYSSWIPDLGKPPFKNSTKKEFKKTKSSNSESIICSICNRKKLKAHLIGKFTKHIICIDCFKQNVL